jgi:alpha-tubulin suppressor-like RCC1 family protein
MEVKVVLEVDEDRLKKRFKEAFPNDPYQLEDAIINELGFYTAGNGIRIKSVIPSDAKEMNCPTCKETIMIDKFEIHECKCGRSVLPCVICQFAQSDEGCRICPFTSLLDEMLN